MRSNYRDISRLRIRVIEWDVLLHGQIQYLFLFVGRRCWVLSDMLAGDDMFHDAKGAGRSHSFVNMFSRL